MLQFSQQQWSTLWTVTQAGAVVNERAAGITGNLNPLQVNQYHTNVLFAIRTTASTGRDLTSVRIYGAGDTNGFPPAGTPLEAIVTTATNIALNQGVFRIAAGRNRDDGEASVVRDQLRLLPQWLLLEYTTGAVAGSITFVIEACFLGPSPQGNE